MIQSGLIMDKFKSLKELNRDIMIEKIMKSYSISKEKAKQLVEKEREKLDYCISETQAMIYLINKTKKWMD